MLQNLVSVILVMGLGQAWALTSPKMVEVLKSLAWFGPGTLCSGLGLDFDSHYLWLVSFSCRIDPRKHHQMPCVKFHFESNPCRPILKDTAQWICFNSNIDNIFQHQNITSKLKCFYGSSDSAWLKIG